MKIRARPLATLFSSRVVRNYSEGWRNTRRSMRGSPIGR
jgi:hypothetical protein